MYATETEDETQIHTYGLLGWHIGTRSGRFRRGDQHGLRNEVQRLWAEMGGSWNILNVESLSNPPMELHVIVEFFEGRLDRHNDMPSLRRTFSYQASRPRIEAAYQPSDASRNEILYHGGFDNQCAPWQQHRCSVRVDNTILTSGDRTRLHTGSLVDIWIYDIEDDEASSLMQRPVDTTTPESSEEDQIWSTLHMPEETFPVTLRTGGAMTILESINQEWRNAGKTCGYTAIHEVHEPPDDLATVTSRTVILEHPMDLVSRLAPSDVLALVDIELISPSVAMDRFTLRQVFWLRNAMSYNTVLHFLLAYEMCERDPEIRCTLQHNRQVWDRRDDAFYVIANGDYIKLQIVGSEGMGWTDLQSTLRHVELTLQRRSIYGTVPSSTGGVSMSDPDEDLHPMIEPDGEPEACNMIQVATRYIQYQVKDKKQDATQLRVADAGPGETPVSWTHVPDLWCSPQGLHFDPTWTSYAFSTNGTERFPTEEPQARRFQISLAAHVDSRGSTECSRNFDLPINISDVANFLTAWTNAPLSAVHDLPSTVELKEPTMTVLKGQSKEVTTPVLHLFTDGSSADGSMSWSFVAVATDNENYRSATAWKCLGYACGHVEVSPQLPAWKGAERANAYVAETEALINAQWWALTHDLRCPIHFHFDALSAGTLHAALGASMQCTRCAQYPES